MSEQEFGRRRGYPSLGSLEREFDDSLREERERERRDRAMRQILYSDEPAERLAVKAVAAGLVSYVQHEDLYYSSYYQHKKGWFGHTTDEEGTTKRIRRLVVER